MFNQINNVIIPYISGLWTLPWILIGFILTIILGKLMGRGQIDKLMKKIGLMILFFFVPVLIFRIFLNTSFGAEEIEFSIIVISIIALMYMIAFIYAKYSIDKFGLTGQRKNLYYKTILTNQGRSSAFIGSMMLGVEAWRVPAAINMALVGIALFAAIPAYLSYLHRKENKNKKNVKNVKALPWFLKLYPWYLIIFVLLGIIVQKSTYQTSSELLGYEANTILTLYTAITIPAALYYVGAGIHPNDLKKVELKKLIGLDKKGEKGDHWSWVRHIFLMTVIITPLITAIIFIPLYMLGFILAPWFVVIIINSFLPITSTNMFLIPYGIDKKSTAHVVTWTTLVCVPIVVALIIFFGSISTFL